MEAPPLPVAFSVLPEALLCQPLDTAGPGGLRTPRIGMMESRKAEPLCPKGQSKGPQDKQTT